MTRGLVLGKFAPLHRGHQSLIEHALRQTDETVVLVYDSPQVTRIPLAVRAGWVRTLYPQAVVIEGRDAPSEAGNDPRIMRLQEDYIRRVVPGPITHFFSSEWYGEHVSRSLNAVDVRVDGERTHFPVSGTAVRRDPRGCRAWIDPLVYRDLSRWVVVLGAESTGKSTLAAALAQAFATVHVEEVGREFWARHHDVSGRLSPSRLVQLAREHRLAEEEAAQRANHLLFVDTDATITRLYARWYHAGSVEPALEKMAQACTRRYHMAVLCGDDFPYVEDGTRAGAVRRGEAQALIRAELMLSGRDWIEVTGDPSARVAAVRRAIEERRWTDWV